MTLWDYLHLHPWFSLLHGLTLVFIIMIAMHAAIGAIGMWFGTARKLRDLEEAFVLITGTEHSNERMAVMMTMMMGAMEKFQSQKPEEDLDGEKAPTS